MVRAALKQARRIERQDYVPDSRRTPDRDEAADWIDMHVVDGDRDWGETTMSEIAEAAGYSREHIATTLDHYYQPAGQSQDLASELAGDIPTPEGTSEFRDGFAYGWREGVRWALRHGDAVTDELASDDAEISNRH